MNGLFILIPLIVFLIFLPSLYTRLFQPVYNSYEDQRILDSLVAVIEVKRDSMAKSIIEPQLFDFDPNKISQDSLLLLGLKPAIAQRIVNYRSKKGVYRKPADLAKMYGLTDSVFQVLRPFIVIPDNALTSRPAVPKPMISFEPTKDNVVSDTKVRPAALTIEVNTADSALWVKLRGIGPVYSSRIIRFRSALGGFAAVGQVAEVYGLSDSLFQAIEGQLLLTDSTVQKLAINLISFKELNAHPYISYEQTKEVFNSKSKIGKYKSIDDLLKLKSFDSLSVKRLIPYLDFR